MPAIVTDVKVDTFASVAASLSLPSFAGSVWGYTLLRVQAARPAPGPGALVSLSVGFCQLFLLCVRA